MKSVSREYKFVLHIKEILKRSVDQHNQFTPFELCDEILNKIPELNNNQDIMIMFNLEFLYVLKTKINNLDNVWFFTPCELKAKAAISMGIKEKHIVKWSYNKKEIIGDIDMPKFDVVVGNPPYLMGTHLKFLYKSIEITKKNGCIVLIHPAQWLLVEGKKNFTNIEKKLFSVFNKNTISIELIIGKKYFSAGIGNVLSINFIHLNNKKNIKIIDNIFTDSIYELFDIKDLSKFGNKEIYINLKNKIIKYTKDKNILSYINKNIKNYIVNVPRVRGHIDNVNINKIYLDDFYTLLPKSYIEPERCIDKNKNRWFSFDTKKEGINFINYLKTNFVRFCLAIRKNNIATFQTSECNLIPWLDFSQEWTDEKLYKYFDLSQEEIEFIEENIPNYYND